MDWSGCELVEVIEGKVSGRPIVVNTRIPADLVLDYVDSGYSVDEIIKNYPSLTPEIISGLVSFAHTQQAQAVR